MITPLQRVSGFLSLLSELLDVVNGLAPPFLHALNRPHNLYIMKRTSAGGLKTMSLLKHVKKIAARDLSSRSFVCYVREGIREDARKASRNACKGIPFYAEHKGRRYCVLHYPGEDKEDKEFQRVIERKLAAHDFRFSYAYFPEGTSEFQNWTYPASVDTFPSRSGLFSQSNLLKLGGTQVP